MSYFNLATAPKYPYFSIFKILCVAILTMLLSACAPKVERQFKQGCKEAGGNKAFCSCVYDKLEAHYGTQTLKDIEDIYKVPADFNERGQAYTLKCIHKLK